MILHVNLKLEHKNLTTFEFKLMGSNLASNKGS